jgi:hypothetical protein
VGAAHAASASPVVHNGLSFNDRDRPEATESFLDTFPASRASFRSDQDMNPWNTCVSDRQFPGVIVDGPGHDIKRIFAQFSHFLSCPRSPSPMFDPQGPYDRSSNYVFICSPGHGPDQEGHFDMIIPFRNPCFTMDGNKD